MPSDSGAAEIGVPATSVTATIVTAPSVTAPSVTAPSVTAPSVTPGLAERLATVDSDIADAATAAGRNPSEITRIVITKFQPVSMVRELFELGVRDFGENRHQEAQGKALELADLDLRWHFVGQLQSNKARQVRDYVAVVHSVDRASLATALQSDGVALPCFIQLNLTNDHNRGGVRVEDLDALVESVLTTQGLQLLGVMAVAPLGEDPREAFERVRLASERVRSAAPEARFISAGMSADFRDAILEGATHLRIGSAITGNRP